MKTSTRFNVISIRMIMNEREKRERKERKKGNIAHVPTFFNY